MMRGKLFLTTCDGSHAWYMQSPSSDLDLKIVYVADMDELLAGKLPEVLTGTQRRHKVHNLLSRLSRQGLIVNDGSRRYPRWQVADAKGTRNK